MTDSDLDPRLQRLARATAGLRARPGFTDRVMQQVSAASVPNWLDAVTVMGKRALAVAAVVVLAAVGWAFQSENAATEASAVAFFSLELEP